MLTVCTVKIRCLIVTPVVLRADVTIVNVENILFIGRKRFAVQVWKMILLIFKVLDHDRVKGDKSYFPELVWARFSVWKLFQWRETSFAADRLRFGQRIWIETEDSIRLICLSSLFWSVEKWKFEWILKTVFFQRPASSAYEWTCSNWKVQKSIIS